MVSKKRQDDPPRRPAPSFEDRENQMINHAVTLAEKQLLDGSASAQTINHYLKLGSTRERLERERLQRENTLLEAKVEALASQKNVEILLGDAIKAMGIYTGSDDEESEEFYD